MTVGPASVKSAEQVSKLEIPTGVHIVVLSIKAVWNRTPLFQGSQSFLFKSSIDWMRPTHYGG